MPTTTAPDVTSTTSVGDPTTLPETTTTTVAAEFGISSPAFADGAPIPVEHTCDGADVSPELNIVGIPESAESIVLIVDDPDAPLGTWDHWVEFDISAETSPIAIAEGAGSVGVQGVNSWNLPGYNGPCPPQGEEHEYVFTVYALDSFLDLAAGVDSQQVYPAMDGRILDSVELTGTYSR